MIIFIIATILSITACAFVLAPLLRRATDVRERSASAHQRELSDLHWQSNRIRNTLQDLELDFQTGKLSQDDYDELAKDQKQRLNQVTQRSKALIGVDSERIKAELEKQIAARRSAKDHKVAGLVCPQCGHALQEEDKFCANCGTKINKS